MKANKWLRRQKWPKWMRRIGLHYCPWSQMCRPFDPPRRIAIITPWRYISIALNKDSMFVMRKKDAPPYKRDEENSESYYEFKWWIIDEWKNDE